MAAPLAKYRVIHLTTNLPGPMTAARLAEHGAQVTKVEGPAGDALEAGAPRWYKALHQGQTIHKIDLKTADGMKKMEELIAGSDLFLTTVRPQGLERLGLDWKSVHRKYPKVSMVQIQGYPTPKENAPAHDLLCQAHVGLISPPAMPRALVSDFAVVERAFSAALLCLIASRETSQGQHAAVSLQEAAEAFAAAYRQGLTREDGVLGGAHPGYRLYRAKEGWIAFAALEPHFMERFKEKLELKDSRGETLAKVFGTKSAHEWEEFGEKNDVPIAAVADSEDA